MNELLAIPLVSYIIFNWPLYMVALLVGFLGIGYREWGMVFLSAILIVPYTFVLNGIPPFRGFALLLPILHVGSAVALKDDRVTLAYLLLAPTLIIRMWLVMLDFAGSIS